MLDRPGIRGNDGQVSRPREFDNTASRADNGYVKLPRRMIDDPPPLFLEL
jgi:hypothetical protein